MIETIDNVSIVVDNIDSAVKWYRDVIGLKHKFTEEGIQWAEMDVGGRSTLALKTSGKTQICLVVSDMDQEMKRLEALDVKFSEVFVLPGGMGRVTSFNDPWGNEIGFYETPTR